MKAKLCILAATMMFLALCATYAVADPPGFAENLSYKQSDGAVDIMKGTQVVARYVYKDTTRPYIYPILSPAGVAVTRDFPMKQTAGDPTDHPHQKSMWIGFGDINGIDFWTDGDKCGKIVQKTVAFDPIAPGPYWSIHTTNEWLAPNGKKLLDDERKTAFYSCDAGTIIVTALTLTAADTAVHFNDSKEGFFAMRLAPKLALKDGTGHILNSEDAKDGDVWGKPARWVDYTGVINGKTVGITMFDSPRNHGYPTYWHARDYGLLAANPFGGKAFTGDDKNNKPFILPYDNKAEFTYIVLIHDGKLDASGINNLAYEFVGGEPVKVQPNVLKPQKSKSTKPAANSGPAIRMGKPGKVVK